MQYNHYLTSSEIRSQARRSLNGRWREVILLHLVPILISILVTGGVIGFSLLSISRMAYEETEPNIIINFVVSFISIGISFTLLDMVRNQQYTIQPLKDAFQVFSRKYFIPVLLIQLLQTIFVTLWTFLFIIPGIIKGYAYSQAFYIYKDKIERHLDEYPTAIDCITESKEMMHGHKLRLFNLQLSFIGWLLLEIFTLGIASLYVRPYMATAEAIFYDNLQDVSKGMPYDYEYRNVYEETNEDDFVDF